MNKKNVLIFSNREAVSERLKRIITENSKIGHSIRTVNNEREATMHAAKTQVLLFDYEMPGFNPNEYVRALREGGFKGKIIRICDMNEHAEFLAAKTSGADTSIPLHKEDSEIWTDLEYYLELWRAA